MRIDAKEWLNNEYTEFDGFQEENGGREFVDRLIAAGAKVEVDEDDISETEDQDVVVHFVTNCYITMPDDISKTLDIVEIMVDEIELFRGIDRVSDHCISIGWGA